MLLGQIGVASGLTLGGYALEEFGNVEEPKEVRAMRLPAAGSR